MRYTIQKLADMAGVSVRTLHYYDEIALLKPLVVGENGYRYYGKSELIKLQQILFFRELEFPLDHIKKMMSDPNFDTNQALKDQRQMLELKKERINTLLQTIDERMNKGDGYMNTNTIFNGFSTDDLEKLKKEAQQRWGTSDAYRQSVERTKNWTQKDYDRVAQEGLAWTAKFASLMKEGLPVQNAAVQKMIDEHYHNLETFYEPTYELYKGLAELYVSDPRFKAYYEKYGEGLTQYMHDAMIEYIRQRPE